MLGEQGALPDVAIARSGDLTTVKYKALFVVLCVVGAAIALESWQAFRSQQQVKHLLATNECRGCNLKKANLQGMNLEGVDLEEANLSGANLRNTRLGRAKLAGVNLENANLEGADLGCVALNFDLQADNQETTVNFNLDDRAARRNPDRGAVEFNLNANNGGATLKLNLYGCANLEGANLTQATMPDGQVHP